MLAPFRLNEHWPSHSPRKEAEQQNAIQRAEALLKTIYKVSLEREVQSLAPKTVEGCAVSGLEQCQQQTRRSYGITSPFKNVTCKF